MPLDERDKDRIRAVAEMLTTDHTLVCVATQDPRSASLKEFCRLLEELATPRVRCVAAFSDEAPLPAVVLRDLWYYHAVPLRSELDPFLDLLRMLDQNAPLRPERLLERVADVSLPARLEVFVSPHCPFCPQVVSQLLPFPLVNPRIRLHVVDGVLFAEEAERANIRATPTVLLDGGLRWTGQLYGHMDELIQVLADRDPSQLDREAFTGMLKEGNADALAALILQAGAIPPAFIEVLSHPEWSVRLGALVVFEEVAERDLTLAQTSIPAILEALEGVEETIQGDLIYLLGTIGTREVARILEARRSRGGGSEALREAIDEALGKLTGSTS
jgi:hypothetical protein